MVVPDEPHHGLTLALRAIVDRPPWGHTAPMGEAVDEVGVSSGVLHRLGDRAVHHGLGLGLRFAARDEEGDHRLGLRLDLGLPDGRAELGGDGLLREALPGCLALTRAAFASA